MANSIPAPWIKKKVMSILGEPFANRHRVITHQAKIVQVIDANASVGTIWISDKNNSVAVMLTPDCVTELMKQHSNLSDIKYSFVKLVSYHFSTPIQGVKFDDEKKFLSQNITFPLVIQCSRLDPVGGYDCAVLGDPCDINKDEDFTKLLKGMRSIDVAAKLGVRQFPQWGSLPNRDGEFLAFDSKGDDYALEHFIMSSDQQMIVDGMNARLLKPPALLVYNETQIDETQRDEVDDVEDESIDPSGGLELEFVDTQSQNNPDPEPIPELGPILKSEPILEVEPTNLRRSTRNQKVDKVLEENWITQPLTQDFGSLSCEDTSSQPLPLPFPLPSKSTHSTRKRSPEVDSTLIGRKIRKTFGDQGEFDGTVTEYSGHGKYLLVYEDGDSEEQYKEEVIKLLIPVHPVGSDAVVEVEPVVEEEVQEEDKIRDVPIQTIKKEVKYTVINDRLSCSSAQSSSSSSGSRRGRGEHQYQRPLGDIFIRYVYDQDGVRKTLRGEDADASLYKATMRLDHYDSDEDVVGMSKDAQKRRKYSTISCGYAPNGTVRRVPKKEMRYSKENLKALFQRLILPRTTVPVLEDS